ncbi:MAG: YbaK/EbsC family protein [Burkholderiaceae bacterium]|nr:YbaK/EbsC family protein [Burkholderiaceae bacterium]
MLDSAARTAQQAADALGVALGQIAKSIIFRRLPDDAAVLVITSGDRRVDEHKVQALVCQAGQSLGRASAEFVRARTGFAIGGVSPVGHAQPPVTLIDEELYRFDQIWAAAGHPMACSCCHHRTWGIDAGAGARCDGALESPHACTVCSTCRGVFASRSRAQGGALPLPCVNVCRMSPPIRLV